MEVKIEAAKIRGIQMAIADAYKAIRVPEESIVNYIKVAKSFLNEVL